MCLLPITAAAVNFRSISGGRPQLMSKKAAIKYSEQVRHIMDTEAGRMKRMEDHAYKNAGAEPYADPM